MSEYGGKYRARLRLIDVPRTDPYAELTELFTFEEDEEIVNVQWFSDTVSVTVAKVEWSKTF